MMRAGPPTATIEGGPGEATLGGRMYWGIGGAAVLYIVLLITLGVMTLRKGHWVMFILGIFLPFFWLIGAVIPPIRPQAAS
jgi:hypothetical protein